jgi:hypothetical protein
MKLGGIQQIRLTSTLTFLLHIYYHLDKFMQYSIATVKRKPMQLIKTNKQEEIYNSNFLSGKKFLHPRNSSTFLNIYNISFETCRSTK